MMRWSRITNEKNSHLGALFTHLGRIEIDDVAKMVEAKDFLLVFGRNIGYKV
jgi:hypothetical protein